MPIFIVLVKCSFLTNSRVLTSNSNMTNSFLKLLPKTQNTFLVPNLRIFYFCTKRCVLKNYRVLIGSRIKAFSNFSPKIQTTKRHFWSKTYGFYFCTKLCILKISRVAISNTAKFVQRFNLKLPKQEVCDDSSLCMLSLLPEVSTCRVQWP